MVQPKQWDEMLRTLLSRAPIILPIIWLAIFSGTRRSQYERLYQEYAHKEALASSYESYRNQIKQLNTTSEDLQKELLSKAIDAISFNASKTLDGKHSEKPPTSKIFESIDIEKLKQLKSIFSKPSSD
jgi:predicted membrane chloride channel (bestrophin family)